MAVPKKMVSNTFISGWRGREHAHEYSWFCLLAARIRKYSIPKANELLNFFCARERAFIFLDNLFWCPSIF